MILAMYNSGQRFVDRDDEDQVVKFSKDKASKSAVAIEETKLFDDNFFSEDFDASLEELHLQEEEEYHEEEVSGHFCYYLGTFAAFFHCVIYGKRYSQACSTTEFTRRF